MRSLAKYSTRRRSMVYTGVEYLNICNVYVCDVEIGVYDIHNITLKRCGVSILDTALFTVDMKRKYPGYGYCGCRFTASHRLHTDSSDMLSVYIGNRMITFKDRVARFY